MALVERARIEEDAALPDPRPCVGQAPLADCPDGHLVGGGKLFCVRCWPKRYDRAQARRSERVMLEAGSGEEVPRDLRPGGSGLILLDSKRLGSRVLLVRDEAVIVPPDLTGLSRFTWAEVEKLLENPDFLEAAFRAKRGFPGTTLEEIVPSSPQPPVPKFGDVGRDQRVFRGATLGRNIVSGGRS